MKIGIMGGTFDPIHNGHLMLGEAAHKLFKLDEVWYLPNGNPPHKQNQIIKSDAASRTAMVSLAIQGHRAFRLELYEAHKPGISYSYETMEFFRKNYPEDEFYFIIGADSLFAIESWVHPRRLLAACIMLAACRNDIDTKAEMNAQIRYLEEKYSADIRILGAPLLHVSSSEIRMRVASGREIGTLVPETVQHYIREHGLYRKGPL